MSNNFKASSVYFAAANAAEEALPPHSRDLIVRYDQLQRAWAKAGFQTPLTPDLIDADNAIDADPLANFAMECRRQGNVAFCRERRAESAIRNPQSAIPQEVAA